MNNSSTKEAVVVVFEGVVDVEVVVVVVVVVSGVVDVVVVEVVVVVVVLVVVVSVVDVVAVVVVVAVVLRVVAVVMVTLGVVSLVAKNVNRFGIVSPGAPVERVRAIVTTSSDDVVDPSIES